MRLLARASALAIPLRDSSVHCVVTSPPYWGLRDYGIAGQLGLERTPEEYVARMVDVFREVRRVLRDDGTLWLNLGDSYAAGGMSEPSSRSTLQGGRDFAGQIVTRERAPGLKPKDLVGIPWRVAFALQADGWYLRSDIIWAKPNPMPESVRDRPTKAHEYVFLLSKSATYFYDADAVKEEPVYAPAGSIKPNAKRERNRGGRTDGYTSCAEPGGFGTPFGGRNRRSVWTVATQPYSGAHFATFPEKLIEPCILAGTSAKGCCPECGAPWERVVDKQTRFEGNSAKAGRDPDEINASGKWRNGGEAGNRNLKSGPVVDATTTGWRPTCDHNHEPVPCRVLDPFAGTATAVRVANRLGRKGIGLDINPKYLALADDRTSNVQMEFA